MIYKLAVALAVVGPALAADYTSSSSSASSGSTCYDLKAAYQGSACCGTDLSKITDYTLTAGSPTIKSGTNICEGKKPGSPSVFDNTDCFVDNVAAVAEQAGANITKGYVGSNANTAGTPILTTYLEAGLCPVNVHWHIGAEHYSAGEFDEFGSSPEDHHRRKLGEGARHGFKCRHYDDHDPKFTTPYDWKYCVGAVVGETYEIHWPHSAAGACGTPNQYQTPFYDGVFCIDGILSLEPLNTFEKIGVQGQVFTIVNDENYYYPDLMRGMIIDGDYGQDIAYYTGSTTGTTRDNEVCSAYTPITWQVDRKCQMISASSFDKMCKDMMEQRDDMGPDLVAHGARALVADELAATNHVRRALDSLKQVEMYDPK